MTLSLHQADWHHIITLLRIKQYLKHFCLLKSLALNTMRGVYLELLQQHDVKHNGLVEIAPHTLADLGLQKNRICRIMQASFCKRHNLWPASACCVQCTVLFAVDDTEIRKWGSGGSHNRRAALSMKVSLVIVGFLITTHIIYMILFTMQYYSDISKTQTDLGLPAESLILSATI